MRYEKRCATYLIVRFSALVFCALSLVACGTETTRPPAWGPYQMATTGGCIDLTGVYDNTAQEAPSNPPWPGYDQPKLSQILMPDAAGGASYVEILRLSQNRMQVTLWSGKHAVETRKFERSETGREGGFDCNGSVLTLDTREPLFTEGLQGSMHTILRMMKDQTGSLVTQFEIRQRGMAMVVVPYGSSSEWWFRFRKTEKKTGSE